MDNLVLLVFWTSLAVFTSEAYLNGNLCQTHYIDMYRQPVGSLHVIVPDLDTDCTIQLNPELNFSVVLSVLQYYVPETHLLSVEDSDGFKISLLGKGMFLNNKKALISERSMKIRYLVNERYTYHAQTTPSTMNKTEWEYDSTELLDANNTVVKIMNETDHSSTGFGFFHFTYNQVGNPPCGKSDFACQNGKCLPEIYVCSGHNRCGDNSDNKNCGALPTTVPTKSIILSQHTGFIHFVILCGIFGLMFFIVFHVLAFVACCEYGKSNNSTPPLQSVSSNVDASTDQPARVPKEASASMRTRVQNSFSQQKDDKVKENLQPLPSQRIKVPSMYPSLQPTAPEEYSHTSL